MLRRRWKVRRDATSWYIRVELAEITHLSPSAQLNGRSLDLATCFSPHIYLINRSIWMTVANSSSSADASSLLLSLPYRTSYDGCRVSWVSRLSLGALTFVRFSLSHTSFPKEGSSTWARICSTIQISIKLNHKLI